MRRIIQCSAVVLLTLSSSLAIAGGYDYPKDDLSGYNLQPGFQVSGDSDYSRNGHAFYIFGGYNFIYDLLSGSSQTLFANTSSGAQTISYVPSTSMPSTFNGVMVGMGKELSRHFDVQISYFQQLEETQNSTVAGGSLSYETRLNGVLGDLAYIFNPDDQFQVLAKAGVALTEYDDQISWNSSGYTTLSDSTKVDPAIGMEFVTYCTKAVAIRLSGMYVAETQDSNSDGQMLATLGVSYAFTD